MESQVKVLTLCLTELADCLPPAALNSDSLSAEDRNIDIILGRDIADHSIISDVDTDISGLSDAGSGWSSDISAEIPPDSSDDGHSAWSADNLSSPMSGLPPPDLDTTRGKSPKSNIDSTSMKRKRTDSLEGAPKIVVSDSENDVPLEEPLKKNKKRKKKKRKSKKQKTTTTDDNDELRTRKKIERFVKILLEDAEKYKVVLDVSIKEMLNQEVVVNMPAPDTWNTVDHDPESKPRSTLFVDRDGIPLVLHMPRFLPNESHEMLLKVLTDFGKVVEDYLSVGKGADATGRNSKSSYRKQKGELAGCINIALWHAIGHTATESIFSRDQLRTSATYSTCAQLVHQLRQVSHKLNEALRLLDPDAYSAQQILREKLKAKYPHVRARSTIDPFLFQGRSIIFNRQTPDHKDKREPLIGWTPLFVLGRFIGGWLRIRRLGLRLWYGPGACIFLRGGLLPHEVEPFENGQRICVASFLHQSVWDDVNMIPASTGIPQVTTVKPLTIIIPPLNRRVPVSSNQSVVHLSISNDDDVSSTLRRGSRTRIATSRSQGGL